MHRYLATLFLSTSFVIASAQRASSGSEALQAAAAAGDWARTESLAKAALARNGRDAIAWTFLGFAHDHLQQAPAALHDFAEAARFSPQATFAHNNYGASLEANNRKAEAAVEYRKSLALDPNQPAALVNLARLLGQSGHASDSAESRTLLKKAWATAPDAEIARSLLLLEPCASAATHEDVDTNLAAYSASVAGNAIATPVLERQPIGAALLRCDRAVEALTFYSALAVAEPADPASIEGKARAQLALGQTIDAGKTLELAIHDGQRTPAIYAALSEVYSRTGHKDHAVDAMRLAVEAAPNDEKLLYQYGILLLDVPAPKATEMRVRQGLEHNPSSSALWFLLGLAQFDQTQPAAAQVSFDRSIALRPNFAPALAYRGLCALDQTNYTEAESFYRKAIAADPSAADLHVLLAEALEKENTSQIPHIRTELNKAIAIDPNIASAHLALGKLDLRNGNPTAAVASLQTALRLDAKQRQAHFYLSRAYRQLHQNEKSAEEAKLFNDQEANAQAADRAAIEDSMRQLAKTKF